MRRSMFFENRFSIDIRLESSEVFVLRKDGYWNYQENMKISQQRKMMGLEEIVRQRKRSESEWASACERMLYICVLAIYILSKFDFAILLNGL